MVNWRIPDPSKRRGGRRSSFLLSQDNKGLWWSDPGFPQKAKTMDFKYWHIIQLKKKKLFGANKIFVW